MISIHLQDCSNMPVKHWQIPQNDTQSQKGDAVYRAQLRQPDGFQVHPTNFGQ